jgi:hypothetical protein
LYVEHWNSCSFHSCWVTIGRFGVVVVDHQRYWDIDPHAVSIAHRPIRDPRAVPSYQVDNLDTLLEFHGDNS